MSVWETFCDDSYYHLWRVRRKSERNFNDGFHVQDGKEAAALVELLNRLERERDEAREEWGKASMDAAQLLSEKTYVIAERDEAREFCFQMVDLVAYGLGQNGSFWSQKAMSEAREAISKAKALEAAK